MNWGNNDDDFIAACEHEENLLEEDSLVLKTPDDSFKVDLAAAE